MFCSKEVVSDKKQWHLPQILQIRETFSKEFQQKIENGN